VDYVESNSDDSGSDIDDAFTAKTTPKGALKVNPVSPGADPRWSKTAKEPEGRVRF
jgi:hypothetical protein